MTSRSIGKAVDGGGVGRIPPKSTTARLATTITIVLKWRCSVVMRARGVQFSQPAKPSTVVVVGGVNLVDGAMRMLANGATFQFGQGSLAVALMIMIIIPFTTKILRE